MKIVTISSKSQVTIPKELLLELNLQPQAKLILQREKEFFVMKPLKTSVVEQTAGSLTPYVSSIQRGISLAEILKETKKKTAAKLAKES